MQIPDPASLLEHFINIPDPRNARGTLHSLRDIIVISILAVISGANTFVDIAGYAKAKEPWLRTFLQLTNGTPSHDTFNHVFAILNPHDWHSRFLRWAQELKVLTPELEDESQEILALDGKTARRARNADQHGLHTISVWAVNAGIVLAQAQVPEKQNEITALPDLIETSNVAGSIVTMDALCKARLGVTGTQKNIAWRIREHHADYMLALKDNHPKLAADVTWLFDHADSLGWQGIPHGFFESFTKAHGREETRRYWVLSDLSLLENRASWRDLQCVVRVESTRVTVKGTSVERRYFLTSLPCDVQRCARAIRLHWGVENCLHWVLDMAFGEDSNRAREGNVQANLVTVRHVALNLLKLERSLSVGVLAKRLRAGWDEAYLLRVVGIEL